MNEAVVASGVSKRYGETVALDGVDLSVADGEVFGLIGPNGAGKTTLVRALTGTTAVDGEITVNGAAPTAVDADRIGLLPQSFAPPARLTARELIDYYGGLYETARETDEVLAAVGMADDADSWYETLSGGNSDVSALGSRWSTIPICSSLMSRQPGSTPRADSRCGRCWRNSPTAAPRSSSRATR